MFLQTQCRLSEQAGGVAAKGRKAKEALDAALEELGGADKIGGINSLVLKGIQTTLMNSNEISKYEFEIRILLPDSFVRGYNKTDRFLARRPLERFEKAGVIYEDKQV